MTRGDATAVAAALGLLFVPIAVSAEVFKCKDAEGKVTYTDVPCLRSETSSVVDTRANVADHSSIRKQSARSAAAAAAPAPQATTSPGSGKEPPAEPPAPRSPSRSSGYSR